jgi:hypothetical protein
LEGKEMGKKKVQEARVAAIDDEGLLKRDLGTMVMWLVISIAIAIVAAVVVDKLM